MEATGDTVGVTGRVIFLRNTGKLCFATLREGDGTELQAMLSLASVGEDLGGELEELEQRSRPLRRAVKRRAEELRDRGRKKYQETLAELEDPDEDLEDEDEEEEAGSGVWATVLTLGAGLAAAYLLTSERAAPARERVREAAATVA